MYAIERTSAGFSCGTSNFVEFRHFLNIYFWIFRTCSRKCYSSVLIFKLQNKCEIRKKTMPPPAVLTEQIPIVFLLYQKALGDFQKKIQIILASIVPGLI